MSDNFQIYNRNPKLKGVGVPIEWTPERIEEYKRCMESAVYFSENYVKIITVDEGLVNFSPYKFQKDLIQTLDENRFVITKAPRQTGKALCLNTPILTGEGWSNVGDLRVGDKIYGDDGKLTKILHITETMYNRECYEVEFDTGEAIKTDAEHLWTVSNPDWTKEKTLTTKEILNLLHKKKKSGSGISIKVNKELEFDSRNVEIDPYSLALWLGDGNNYDGRITSSKKDFEFYKTVLPALKSSYEYNDGIQTFLIEGINKKLRLRNLLRNKRIPEDYIFNNLHTRLEILRGLMDSDGYCSDSGNCEFYQKCKNLIDDFRLLLSTLGIKSRVREKKIKGQTYYTVSFSTGKFEVFKLPRKLERQKKLYNRKDNSNFYIKDIKKTKSVPVRCLQVDNDSKLFLVGKQLIPTHNSTIFVAYLLHYILFNENVNVAILANKAKTAKEILKRLKLAFENLPNWLQQGVVSWNITSIEIENGSRVSCDSTSGDSARGESYNLVLLDEYAFVKSSVAKDFFSSVYPTISSGNSTKLFIVSTPNGLNHFYKLWKKAEEGRNEFVPFKVNWWDVPKRDKKWLENERRNLGEQTFKQEVLVEFLGSSKTLISAEKLENLLDEEPIKQTEDGLKIFEKPKEEHVYFAVCDPAEGVGGDYTVINIIDVTKIPYKQVAIWRNNKTSILELPAVTKQLCQMYNEAHILVETNVVGGELCHSLFYDYEYENILKTQRKAFNKPKLVLSGSNFGVKTTQSIKTIGSSTIKSLIENDTLTVCDEDTIDEMKTFIKKGNKYEAESHDDHDDCVMTLVLFAWAANQELFKDITNTNIMGKRISDDSNEPLPAGWNADVFDNKTRKDEDFGWIVQNDSDSGSYF